MVNQGKVFRDATLERLSTPEQLDQLMQITQPRSWFMLLGFLTILAAAVTWGIWGSIPLEISGKGILVNTGGINQIPVLHSGQIASLDVNPRDVVSAGQTIGTLHTADGVQTLTAPFGGQIVNLQVSPGSLVSVGDALATIENIGPDVYQEVVLYLPARDGARIQPGMPAQIVPDVLPETTVGGFMGEIISVSTSPSTTAQALRMVGDQHALSSLEFTPGHIEVRVRLHQSEDGQFLWSSGVHPGIQPTSGSFARTRLVLGELAPIRFLLPGQTH